MPKGSKNKTPRKVTVANNDFEALIAEKTSAKENLTVEIAFLKENLTTPLKADLKAKKTELKKLDTELAKLEEQKAAFDAAQYFLQALFSSYVYLRTTLIFT